ncbi:MULTISPECIES: methionine ABC transporter ATP-binding protein [Chitinophagaceae]
MESIIQLRSVGKSYAKNLGSWAIKDITLDVPKGKIFGIIGSSGAGKSSLLRCINLLERPTTGSVSIRGDDLNLLSSKALNDARKSIGMIFQHFNLLASRTVLENIVLPLKLTHTKKAERVQVARRLLNRVGLSEKENAYPAQLSGGQKQRVAIARALVLNPSILLCDEATSALDPESTITILQLLKAINLELGLTIVLITHEMQVIQQICDYVAVLSHGRLVESGTVTQVFESPVSPVTKSLLRFSALKF